MDYFFEKFEQNPNNRYKCKKVEELIEKYSADVFTFRVNNDENRDQTLTIFSGSLYFVSELRKIFKL